MTDLPIVGWTEIPVTNMKKSAEFYATTFGFKMEPMGDGEEMVLDGYVGGAGANLMIGEPGRGVGPVLHIALRDKLEDAAKRLEKAGGTLSGDIMTIPYGRFQHAQDLDGNRLGLFEPKR